MGLMEMKVVCSKGGVLNRVQILTLIPKDLPVGPGPMRGGVQASVLNSSLVLSVKNGLIEGSKGPEKYAIHDGRPTRP